MLRRIRPFLVVTVILILLVCSSALTMTRWLPYLLGFWLPDNTTLSLQENPRWHDGALRVADIRYRVGNCELAVVKNVSAGRRQQRWQLNAERVVLNHDCLNLLPDNTTPAISASLAAWQRRLPDADIILNSLTVLPWQPDESGHLQLSLSSHVQRVDWSSKRLQLQATLSGEQLTLHRLQLNSAALPAPVTAHGLVTLSHVVSAIPTRGELAGHMTLQNVPHPLTLKINWQRQQGEIRLFAEEDNTPLLSLPWKITPTSLIFDHGLWRWPYGPQPVSGAICLSLTNYQQGLTAMTVSSRLNILTQGHGGKGNLVIALGPGKLGGQRAQLPLRINGTSKLDELMLFASLFGSVKDPLLNPTLQLASGSLLRMRGRLLSTLDVQEARWPLAGIRVSAKGIDGRLQAILTAHKAQLGRFTLHLDGKATHFWPDQGLWKWRYWGNGFLRPLSATWDIKGEGRWQDTLIELSHLSTGFDRLRYAIAEMRAPRLILSEPIRWQRKGSQPELQGGLLLTARETYLSSGGYLPPSTFRVTLTGRDPGWFLWRGTLYARAIGPVLLRGRWDGNRLRGQAWWPQQSLNVFKPLLDPALKMTLQGGTLKAQMAFSAASDQPFEAGGHWVVKNGVIRMPDNTFRGIDFSLPFRLKAGQWQLGVRQPVSLRIKSIESQFTLQNISADLQGFYPWRDCQPLVLSNVHVDLLGGRLRLNQLTLPQKHAAILKLTAIEPGQLMRAINVQQVSLSGSVNGELPLWLENSRWLVKDGWVASQGLLILRMDKKVADAVSANNMATGAALDWLRYMEISRSRGVLNVNRSGLLRMQADVEGKSHFSDKNQHVSLHYTHEENLFQLWRSLRFGDNLQSWIEDTVTLPLNKEIRDEYDY
ncbi:YdbH family protein [Enterobacteriaceae bacterium LUAb1]